MPAIQAQFLSTALSATLLVIGIAALVLLAIGERRASEPIPYKLWRSRIMAGSNVGSLAIGCC